MAEDWPDSPQVPLDDTTRQQYQNTVVGPTPVNPTYNTSTSFGRGAGLVATGALGVPGDIISTTVEPAINWAANKLGIPNEGNAGPQIPIPTTSYIRSRFDMAPPGNALERGLDLGGKAIGSAITSRALPGAGGGAMLSGAAGTVASGLAEDYFPDSWALQLLAGGAAGLATTGLARRLILGGGLRGAATVGGDVLGAVGRELVGNVVGGLIGQHFGVPEYIGGSIGGLAGLMSHRTGRTIANQLFRPSGIRGAVAGALGAIPEALQTYQQGQDWPDNPQVPLNALQ